MRLGVSKIVPTIDKMQRGTPQLKGWEAEGEVGGGTKDLPLNVPIMQLDVTFTSVLSFGLKGKPDDLSIFSVSMSKHMAAK